MVAKRLLSRWFIVGAWFGRLVQGHDDFEPEG